MADELVVMDADEESTALQIFPRVCLLAIFISINLIIWNSELWKVAGLARRVHDSTTLGEKFQKIVDEDEELQGSRRALTRQVPTRWNTDHACLDAHGHFKNPIQILTSQSVNKLSSYRLSDTQWDMLEHLVDILEVCVSTLFLRL